MNPVQIESIGGRTLCTLHSGTAHFTLHRENCAQCTVHTAQCTVALHSEQSKVHSEHFTLCTLHISHCIMHTVHIPQQVEISFLQRKKVGISRKTASHRRTPLIAPNSTNKIPRHGMRFNRFSQSRILANQFHKIPSAQLIDIFFRSLT